MELRGWTIFVKAGRYLARDEEEAKDIALEELQNLHDDYRLSVPFPTRDDLVAEGEIA